MAAKYETAPVRRSGAFGVDRASPPAPIDDSAYQTALEDPEMVEIIAPRHFMRRETWERYQLLFPVFDDRRRAAIERRNELQRSRYALSVQNRAASLAAKKLANS